MRYATVHTRFWIDPDIAALGRDARDLYLYLMTCPVSNMAGYYYLPMAYVVEHLGAKGYAYSIDTLSIALQTLESADKIRYDSAAKVVLVKHHLAWNKPEGPKQVQGVISAVREVPESILLPEFVACAIKAVPKYDDSWKTLLEGYRYPIDTVSIPGTGTGTVNSINDHDDTQTSPSSQEDPPGLHEVEEYLQGRTQALMQGGTAVTAIRHWLALTNGNLDVIKAGIDAGLKVHQKDHPGGCPRTAVFYTGYVEKQWDRYQAEVNGHGRTTSGPGDASGQAPAVGTGREREASGLRESGTSPAKRSDQSPGPPRGRQLTEYDSLSE